MFIVMIFLIGLIAMLLWNALIPDLFHGPMLNYWQALGMVVLTRLLVGFRGPRGHWGRWWWKGGRHRHGRWNRRSRGSRQWGGPSHSEPRHAQWQHWQNMPPEERQRMKEEWKEHFKRQWQRPEA